MYYVGMDVHKRFSQVVVVDKSGKVVEIRRLHHTPKEERCGYFNQFPRAKVRLIVEGRIKTDKVDALVLAQLQRSGFLAQIYLVPPEVRKLRDLFRCRCGLVQARTKLKLQIHALLDRLGYLA